MWNTFLSDLSNSFSGVWSGVALFVPKFVGAVFLLIVGCIIAELLGKAVKHIIHVIKLDELVRSAGVEHYFQRAGIRLDTGVFFGAIVKWFIVIVFLVQSLSVLHLGAVTGFLQNILTYLPQVVVAVLILLAGLLIGEAVERAVSTGARVANFNRAKLLGSVARWAIWIFSVLVALYQLGVAAILSEMVLNGIVIALALAFGLSFGLGGQSAAADFIARVRNDISDKK